HESKPSGSISVRVHWIRHRYGLVPFPKLPKVITRPVPNGTIHKIAVIPSRIGDNRIMLEKDPGYIDRLHLVGSAQLIKGWLEGDWTAIEGAFFDGWSEERNVIRPLSIPREWLHFRSGNWGSVSPFSFGWWAVASDEFVLDGQGKWSLPRGGTAPH